MSLFLLEGWVLVDPLTLAQQCREQDIPTDPWLGKCNSLTFPLGPENGVGYFLVADSPQRRLILSARGLFGYSFTLTITDVSGTAKQSRWYVKELKCVTPGASGDPAAVYMLTVVDYRYFQGWSGLGSIPAGYAINMVRRRRHMITEDVRAFTYSYFLTGNSSTGSLLSEDETAQQAVVSSGDLATWTQLAQLNSVITGSLPYTPDGKPTDFDYTTTDRYIACHAVLDRLGCAAKHELFQTTTGDPFQLTAVELGNATAIAARDAALAQMASYLIWDYDPYVANSAGSVVFRVHAIMRESNVVLNKKTTIGTPDTDLIFFYDPSNLTGASTTRYWAGDIYDTYDRQRTTYATDAGYSDGISGHYTVIDHDNPMMWDAVDTTTDPLVAHTYNFSAGTVVSYISGILASLTQHALKYLQSQLCRHPVNRVYSGFHTNDDLLPGGAMKIVRWEDVGDGPKTHFYAGDNYLPPHSIYHAVNPHKFHRTDDLARFRSITDIDLSKL